MVSRRGFLGTLAAVAVAPRVVIAKSAPTPPVPALARMDDVRIHSSIYNPDTMNFKAKRGAFRLGQAVTFAFGADTVFSGIVQRIEHMPDGDHIFAQDPAPIPFDVRAIYAL